MIFRLQDFIFYPAAIRRHHQLLRQSERWSSDRLRAYQQEYLCRTLWHAVQHVPYYRRTLGPYRGAFTEMVDRLDLRELPLLTKEDVRNHYRELCAENAREFYPVPTRTSGSTGTPTEFLLDACSNVTHFASIWRVLNWAGYRFGNRFADLTGYVPRHGRLVSFDPRLNCLHLSSFNFKKENMGYYVDRLTRFRPVLIKAYPSAIDLFSRWLEDAGIAYRPPIVLCCAESLLDHQRATIERVLQCRVFDFYNQNERAALISTCPDGTYHVHEEYSFVELLENGRPSSDAAEIVTTSFHNRAMPLVRYKTDDLAMPSGQSVCRCGRALRPVGRLVGRIEDIVVTPDGRYVGRLDAALKYSPGVRLSQIVQETISEIEVRLVRADSFRQSDVDTIERELRARLGPAIRIRYRYVDAIPPGRNGKVKFVESRPGREALGQPPVGDSHVRA